MKPKSNNNVQGCRIVRSWESKEFSIKAQGTILVPSIISNADGVFCWPERNWGSFFLAIPVRFLTFIQRAFNSILKKIKKWYSIQNTTTCFPGAVGNNSRYFFSLDSKRQSALATSDSPRIWVRGPLSAICIMFVKCMSVDSCKLLPSSGLVQLHHFIYFSEVAYWWTLGKRHTYPSVLS